MIAAIAFSAFVAGVGTGVVVGSISAVLSNIVVSVFAGIVVGMLIARFSRW